MKQTKQKPEKLFSMIDTIGNELSKYTNGLITLKLISEGGRKRNLGRVEGDTLYVERKFSHLHYKSNSYGFNYIIIKKGSYKYVMLSLEDGTYYKIPRETILSLGKVMYFKNTQDGDSFEVQVFLPVSIIYNFKIESI